MTTAILHLVVEIEAPTNLPIGRNHNRPSDEDKEQNLSSQLGVSIPHHTSRTFPHGKSLLELPQLEFHC